ncbi:MAG: alpha-amylase, partial [Pedobacter sp.]
MINKVSIFFLAAFYALIVPFSTHAQDKAYPAQYGKPFKGVPDRRDVMLYQVNTRAFSKTGDFAGVTARMDAIKDLGINVIYLMPIYPVGKLKGANSPYATMNYDEVGKEFGTLDDLRAVVDGAHKRGMSLILDWVANHTSYDHPWTKDKSWYLQNASGNIISPPNMGWNDVA